jgi:hypothetical protein
VIRCLTNLSYAVKKIISHRRAPMRFPDGLHCRPDRSSADFAICLKKFAIPASGTTRRFIS